MAVFDLSPTDRIALLSKLALIDATLANASMYTPPPTPVRDKKTSHIKEKKKRQKSKFPILESAAVPPPFANAFAAASVSPVGTELTASQSGLNRVETWIDRRFVKVAKAEAASPLSPGLEHPVTIGSLLATLPSWS